jgi:hypothetical protein
MILKIQPNALLTWQNFIIAKIGCYKSTPLKGIAPLRFERGGKKLWVICFELFLMLPGSFIFTVPCTS